MTRLEFAMALGRLAQEHGENLLRVKGLVAFADGDGRPAAIHAVQHTMYPPRWLADWPDGDQSSRLVFIVRDLKPEMILAHFVPGDPVTIDNRESGNQEGEA
jgi:G3E family GTPase